MVYIILGYIIYLVVFAIFSWVILYHIYRYGYKEGASSSMIIFYLVTAITIVVLTFVLLFISGLSLPDNMQFLV